MIVAPWVTARPLSEDTFRAFRRRAIFECAKWDPQVGDVNVLSRVPLVIRDAAWREVSLLASTLARETLAAEAELARRPDLHRRLGLPAAVRRALARLPDGPTGAPVRLIRFDFHFTEDGWRLSEANSDVPGGLNEASGFSSLLAPHYPWATTTGDPAGAYCDALFAAARVQAPTIALVHATSYSDDQQMMLYLSRRLRALGATVHLASPAHVRWTNGRASLAAAWWQGPLDLVVRFFPAEWLPLLPSHTGWPAFFGSSVTPLSNPASAILTQTKRFPLVWDDLDTPLPTWRALLPETRDPRHAPWRRDQSWIVKPALGRVGEGVGIMECLDARERLRIRRAAMFWPNRWIAQRRFESAPLALDGRQVFACLGVYTVNTSVVGAYGRLADRPLIDARAADAAVLRAA